MTERIELERIEKLNKLHHDIQNCLNLISMGTDLMSQSRDNEAAFAKIYGTVRENRIEAAKLVDEFLKTAGDECE